MRSTLGDARTPQGDHHCDPLAVCCLTSGAQVVPVNMELTPRSSAGEINRLHAEICQTARTTIEKAIRIGELLTEQKSMLKHGEWLSWLAAHVEFDQAQSWRYMKVFDERENPKLCAAHNLKHALNLLADGNPAEQKAHVSRNTGEYEWYTPAEYVETARKVMGAIDLDPASSLEANAVIKAATFYTKADNGLDKHWYGRIWMNPPYAQPLISEFARKLVESPDVEQACVLVNNASETEWFQQLGSKAAASCSPRGRVKFWNPNGDVGQPLQGQSVLYFGKSVSEFFRLFREFGLLGKFMA
jgi:hypothetical protein